MSRIVILSLLLLAPVSLLAAESLPPAPPQPPATAAGEIARVEGVAVDGPVVQVPVAAVAPPSTAPALPAMYYLSSVAGDEVLALLKAEPALAALDKELVGSPLTLIVTHTLRPTAGGQAAGLLSAVLSGSTLGIIPIVSNERLVVRYEVLLNGKVVTTHSFERTATRAQNLWTAGANGYGGLGKAGMEWLKSTATEAASKIARDPAMLAVRDEIDFYFAPAAK